MTPSVMKAQLRAIVAKEDPQMLCGYLAKLRNADFRLAGIALADAEIWAEADFWRFATVLVAANSKAYLGTMLKAAITCGETMPTEDFAKACKTEIDKKKVMEALLQLYHHPHKIAELFALLEFDKATSATRANLLFRIGTAPAYYMLFEELKQYEDNPPFLRRYGVELIRRGDKLSFNLASIIQEYFALPELPGSFSLSIPPYELSNLDKSYESFKTILQR